MLGRHVSAGGFAACSLYAEPEGKDVVAHRREAPAEAPVVAAFPSADAEIGRAGEAAAEDGEPVVRFRLEAPAVRRAARWGQTRQGLAVQERVCASRRECSGRALERETACRGRVGVEDECNRYTSVVEAVYRVGQGDGWRRFRCGTAKRRRGHSGIDRNLKISAFALMTDFGDSGNLTETSPKNQYISM